MNEYNYKVINAAVQHYLHGTASPEESDVTAPSAVRFQKSYYCVEETSTNNS